MMMMMIILGLAVIGVFIWLLYCIANRFYRAACEKGYCDRAYFHYCFWLGFVGWLMVIALPDKNARQAVVPSESRTTMPSFGDAP